jgi:hypothetical protein
VTQGSSYCSLKAPAFLVRSIKSDTVFTQCSNRRPGIRLKSRYSEDGKPTLIRISSVRCEPTLAIYYRSPLGSRR